MESVTGTRYYSSGWVKCATMLTVLSLALFIAAISAPHIYETRFGTKDVSVGVDIGAYQTCYQLTGQDRECENIRTDCSIPVVDASPWASLSVPIVDKCGHFNAARAFMALALIFTIVGTILQMVLACKSWGTMEAANNLRISCFVFSMLAVFAGLTSMSLFAHIFRTDSSKLIDSSNAHYSWSFTLLVVAWVSQLLASFAFIPVKTEAWPAYGAYSSFSPA